MKKKEKNRYIDLISDNLDEIIVKFNVRRIGLFGSCMRAEEEDNSDVDILVEFEKKTFDNYMNLKFFLENKFGKEVDLVIFEALKPELREEILSEVTYAA